MSSEQQARMAEHHGFLLEDHDIDYRVITRSNIGDINQFAVEHFAEAGIGEASDAGRGLLLVIDPGQDRVRLEVGNNLEPVFPDAFVAYVEQRQMVPFFRAGRVADGILATTELIIARVQRARANAGFETEAWFAGSGGGGATTTAHIGAGPPADSGGEAGADVRWNPGRTPAETLATYFAAMNDRIANPDLALYTPPTRLMLADWVVTPAQMDNVVRTYRACTAEPTRTRGDYAVIRYPVSQRQCAPYFFERIDGAWFLDLTMMQKAIRFGRNNAWRLEPGVGQPYRFAFDDWTFDRHGFPSGER